MKSTARTALGPSLMHTAALPACVVLLMAGCSSTSSLREYVPQIVTPYRMDVQQGNFVTQDMVDKLQVGQTKDQVRFILGTPMLTDVFHVQRWDFMFSSAKGWNAAEKRRLTVFFDANDKLQKWDAVDVPAAPESAATATAQAGAAPAAAGAAPASAAAPAATEEKPGLFSRMFGWMLPSSKPAPAAAAPVVAAAAAPAPAPAAPTPKPEPVPAPVATPAPVTAPPAPTPAPAVAAAPPPAPAPAPAAAPLAPAVAAAAGPVAVSNAIEQWRAAWSGKNSAAYLALYAPDFKPVGLTRAKWEAQRKERLAKPSFISVKLADQQVTLSGDKAATAIFTQQYESDTLKETGRKTLKLGNYDGKWLIREETFKAQ